MGAGIMHRKPHPLAGQRAVFVSKTDDVADGTLRNGSPVMVRDWYDRVTNSRWLDDFGDDNSSPSSGYMRRRSRSPRNLPKDDEVVIVTTHTGQQRLVHTSEIQEREFHEPERKYAEFFRGSNQGGPKNSTPET